MFKQTHSLSKNEIVPFRILGDLEVHIANLFPGLREQAQRRKDREPGFAGTGRLHLAFSLLWVPFYHGLASLLVKYPPWSVETLAASFALVQTILDLLLNEFTSQTRDVLLSSKVYIRYN